MGGGLIGRTAQPVKRLDERTECCIGSPVGVITACLGGAYLVWLMASSRKERT